MAGWNWPEQRKRPWVLFVARVHDAHLEQTISKREEYRPNILTTSMSIHEIRATNPIPEYRSPYSSTQSIESTPQRSIVNAARQATASRR